MSKVLYSIVGLGSLGAASWVMWSVGEELLYQSRMRPLLEDARILAEKNMEVRRFLGPPPFNIHSGGRHSNRPIFRTFEDEKSGQVLNEAIFWIEGPLGSSRLTVIGDENCKLRHVWIDSRSSRGQIILYSPHVKENQSTLFGYLASILWNKK